MNELRRLLEDNPTGLERDLLTAGVSYGSSDDARHNTLAALGLVGTAAVSASVAAAAASSSALQKLGVLKLVALSTVGVAVLTPVGILAWKQFDVPKPVPAVVATPAPQEQPSPRTPSPAPVVTSETLETPTAEAPAPKADARPSAGVLAAELGELDRARSMLADGDPKGALAVLDDYARTYPRGRLGLEAEVLRIDALAQSGDMQAAKKRAEAFLKRHPKGVLAPRVRRYLDDPR